MDSTPCRPASVGPVAALVRYAVCRFGSRASLGYDLDDAVPGRAVFFLRAGSRYFIVTAGELPSGAWRVAYVQPTGTVDPRQLQA